MAGGKKKTLYYMMPLIALVWGVVFYQLYSYFFSSPVYATHVESVKVNIDEIKRDTFSIVADYRDPFLGKSIKRRTKRSSVNYYSDNSGQTAPKNYAKKEKPKKETVKPWPMIKYEGMIKNHSSDSRVGIMEVNGKEFMIKKGSICRDVEVLKIEKTGIEVSFQKEKKVITK